MPFRFMEAATQMTGSTDHDAWSRWVLERRWGGDAVAMQTALASFLYPVRDTVLQHAALQPGDTLLDVGCGDGLIGFGALERIADSHVIFSDVSQPLLDKCRTLAAHAGVLERCQFVNAAADALTPLTDTSVDAVTTRSVLIYVADKAAAFREFFRVLKPGGRVSIFEPINRFGRPEPPQLFMGYDVTPVQPLADKVKAVFRRRQPFETDPMLNFDERDLLRLAEQASFTHLQLDLHLEITAPEPSVTWERLLHTAGNPLIPTLQEAINEALTRSEAERLTAHLRPLVEAHQGTQRNALAYLWGRKGEESDRTATR